jgi:predicted negative regulator of RcsB-dependent stress response
MSEQPKTPAETPAAMPSIPAFVPEDLVPVWLWLRENGLRWLLTLGVAVLVAVGVSLYLRQREENAARASEELLKQPTIESLEKAVADFGGTPSGVAVALKLAKAYYDAGRYGEALSKYEEFVKLHADHPFADVARVGRGFALCGLTRNDEAIEVFRTFRKENPAHYLAAQAAFGEAACLTAKGKKDDAKSLLQELRAANRESAWDAAAKRMEGAIDRYTPRQGHSLFEQAEALVPIPPAGKPATTNAVP